MQWQSLLKDLMTTGVEINEEGEVVWSLKNLIVFHAISEYSTAYQKKTVTNKTSVEFTKDLLRNSYNPTRWFEQIKRNVSFDVTTQFNSNQQSIAIYNSHIFNGRNATINDQRSTNTYRGFFYYPCVRQYFYSNHMYSNSSHCSVSKLSDYYKIARSFILFSQRKCR